MLHAVRDGGAFTSVRGFQGIPQRDIHFTTTFVRSYAQELEKLDRLRQLVEAGSRKGRLCVAERWWRNRQNKWKTSNGCAGVLRFAAVECEVERVSDLLRFYTRRDANSVGLSCGWGCLA
jgi:hypothetical protein